MGQVNISAGQALADRQGIGTVALGFGPRCGVKEGFLCLLPRCDDEEKPR